MSMVPTIQAIFWDYDNTLYLTQAAHIKKHQEVLKKLGIILDEKKYGERIYKNNGSQNYQWMKLEFDLKVPEEEYLNLVDTKFHEVMDSLEMRPAVKELIEFIHGLGIPQGIVTNGRQNSVEPVLKSKDLLKYMKVVLYKEDYEGRKPHPMPYLEGVKKMSIELDKMIKPSQCIAIEDDPEGVESAVRAGMIVVHRKLSEQDENSKLTKLCCYHEEDFKKMMKNLLS